MKLTPLRALAALLLPLVLAAGAPHAAERVTYKSAKSTSSYYQMAVQLAEAVNAASSNEIQITVEESQGSVQNVMEAPRRSGNYVFTTPPVLVKLALGGKKMFEKAGPVFGDVRSLFTIPSLTMHFVVREDAGVATFEDLAGKRFIIGKGSFGAREAAKYMDLFGVEVDLKNVELSAAVPALANGQVDGFATAGSYPAPNVIEAAATVPVRLISLTGEQVAASKRDMLVIPAGTYKGVDTDTTTTTLPVGVYTTTKMSDDTAYALTKAFWESKAKMGEVAEWWNAVTPDGLATLAAPLHPGAVRYYEEAGVALPN